MPQYVIIREIADGAARLVGVTDETAKTPRQVADAWGTIRALDEPARVYVVDVAELNIFDVQPTVKRSTTVNPVDPVAVFGDDPLIDIDSNNPAPPPAP